MKNFDKALKYSFLLLKYRGRSKFEMISRLRKKGYTPAISKQVVKYLEESNYINDKDFARLFVNYSLEKGWGPKRVEASFKKLGILAQLRKIVYEKDLIYNQKMREIIQEKLRYYKVNKPAIPAQKACQRIVMHLERKGFDREVIYREIRNLGVDSFEDK